MSKANKLLDSLVRILYIVGNMARQAIERVRMDNSIDTVDIMALRLHRKLTIQEIADKYQVSPQTIHNRINKFKLVCDPEALEQFEQGKPAILSMVEKELISDMLDPARREKASLNNVAYAFQQVHTANRLERGQSTSITDTRSLVAHITDLDAKRDRINEELDKLSRSIKSLKGGITPALSAPQDGDNGT